MSGPADPRIVDAMRRALAASALVHGTTSPNPPVGATVLDAAGEVVGVGATAPPGGPHAEVVALREAGERARGGTAVVTLEPCAHHGRTPPCTDALRAAGVAAVHVAVRDPHPEAAGGAEVLRAAGIRVELDVLADEVARGPLRAWLHGVRTGRPHVTWKLAATLDGRSAAADGSSRWITGPAARAQVHALRATADAIVVGTGTALVDDPALTAREADGSPSARQPLRVVVGHRDVARARGSTPPTSCTCAPATPMPCCARWANAAWWTCCSRAARASQGRSWRPAGWTGCWPTSPRPCWARARRCWPGRVWERSRTSSGCRWKRCAGWAATY